MAMYIMYAFTIPWLAKISPAGWNAVLTGSHYSPSSKKAEAILQNIKSLLQMRHRRNRRTNIHRACGHGKCVLRILFKKKQQSLGYDFFLFLISFEQHLDLLLNYE